MTPQELKNSILQLAVQGKLVPQRPEEGSAEELLAAIRTQKQSSDSRSTVRKKKNSHKDTETQSAIPDDEIPFEIPQTWKWVPFGFFMELRMGKTILKSELGMQGVPVYSATQDDSVLGYIENPELELHKNDLVIPARGNSIGCVTLVTDNLATCTQTTICGRNIHSVDVRYIYYCCWAFKSVWFKYVGSAIPQVTVTQIEKCMVPLPPLAEQKRIVAKLEELLPLCDRYGNAYNELQALNKRVPGDLQKSLLQLAVQGKLVPQRPEEGSAEELLTAIRAQKQSSDSRSTVRKKKNSHKDTETQSDVPADEIPFEIPASWKWVRLGEISSSIQYGYNAPAKNSGRIKMVRISDIQDGGIDWSSVPFCEINEREIPAYLLKKDDILFARTGGTVGKSYLVKEVTCPAIYAGYLIRTRYHSSLCIEFVKFFMESPLYWAQLRNGTIATA